MNNVLRMPMYEAIRMAAWAHDKELRDVIAEQAVSRYRETGCKLEYVTFEENERYLRARRIYDEKVREQ